MNKRNLYRTLNKLFETLSNDSIPLLFESLDVFIPIAERVRDDSRNLLADGQHGTAKRSEIRLLIQNGIKNEKNLKLRKIIVQSTRLEDCLQEVGELLGGNNGYYGELFEKIEDKLDTFLTCYEDHARTYSVDSFFSVSLSAVELKTAIESTRQVLGMLLNVSSKGEDIRMESGTQLDLYLSNVVTLKAFSEKLDALSVIYLELLHLYGHTEGDYPVVIEHLENGSLWIKIAGHTLTATLLTSILTTATGYLHEQFTLTGKLNQLPTAVKVADDLLKLSAQLKKDGVDTTAINENIESATRKISKKLDVLLGDQPVVEINNVESKVADAITQNLIQQAKDYKLEHITPPIITNQDIHS